MGWTGMWRRDPPEIPSRAHVHSGTGPYKMRGQAAVLLDQ